VFDSIDDYCASVLKQDGPDDNRETGGEMSLHLLPYYEFHYYEMNDNDFTIS